MDIYIQIATDNYYFIILKNYAADVVSVLSLFFEWTIIGLPWPVMAFFSIITSATFAWLGNSYIVDKSTISRIDLNPLAPVFLLIAF